MDYWLSANIMEYTVHSQWLQHYSTTLWLWLGTGNCWLKVGILEKGCWLMSLVPRSSNNNALGWDFVPNADPKNWYLTTREGNSPINNLSPEPESRQWFQIFFSARHPSRPPPSLLFSGGVDVLMVLNCKLLIKYLNCIVLQIERMHARPSHIPLAVCPCLCSSLKSQWWGSHAELSVPLHPVSAIVTLILSFMPASIRLTVVITRLHCKLTL